MPECGEMESLFGVAVAKMESAKRAILEVDQEMFPGMIRDDERSAWLQKLVLAHMNLERADKNVVDAAALLHPKGERFPTTMATAHPEVQPSPLMNPINKALLEALTKLTNAVEVPRVEPSPIPTLIRFARQAISEAEREGVNLGSPVPKGSDTEVRGDLQALYDIQAEADNPRHDLGERLHRIVILCNDLINSHLKARNA